ncbi:hypothetical protein, partial [Stenotrophomonas maltophilia]
MLGSDVSDLEIFDFDGESSTHGVDRVDQGRHLPTAAGNCRRRGTVGLRGVSRMDAATKPYLMK